MDATTTTANLPRWISDVNELALGWYTAIRRPEQAINVLRPPTAAINVGPGGAAFTIDPNLIIVGALAVVAIVFVLNQ